MRRRERGRVRVAGWIVALLLLPAAGGAGIQAKGPKGQGPMLWIVADRIVGFVPFTVLLYGKVVGTDPGTMELCRSEVAWLKETSAANPSGGAASGQTPGDRGGRPAEGSACATGRLQRTPEGYDYAYDMRFTQPGTFQVRLSMVDAEGKRILSNAVQVNAF